MMILVLIFGAAALLVVLSQVAKIDLKGLLVGASVGIAATLGGLIYFDAFGNSKEMREFSEKYGTSTGDKSAATETDVVDVEVVTSTTTAATENNLEKNCPAYIGEWVVTELGSASPDQNVAIEFCGCIKSEARGNAQIAGQISSAGDRIPDASQRSPEMNEAIATCMQHAAGG